MKKVFLVIPLFIVFPLFAQISVVKEGDARFEKLAYMNAIEIYIKASEKGYGSSEIYKKIGDSYYFNANYVDANKWYEKLFTLTEKIEAEYYYRYAQTLKSIQQQHKANQFLAYFSKLNADDSRSKEFLKHKNYLEDIVDLTTRFKLKTLEFNSENSDYGAVVFGNNLVFTSSRAVKGATKNKDSWTNKPFFGLYSTAISNDSSYSSVLPFHKEISSDVNDATAVFTKSGTTIYFTRNNVRHNKIKKNANNEVLLKIYTATLSNGKWINVTELPFNSDYYNCAHPALSSDEKFLYFSSNMPGTFGQSDLFKVALHEDGTYGKPINLGAQINTEGRETFPYISNDSQLYFASDGHLGLGGLDVFVTSLVDEKAIHHSVYNVGLPINSEFDDFSYSFDTDSRMGYFSSNRPGGKGLDDIYGFKELYPLASSNTHVISGVLIDATTKEPVKEAQVVLLDQNLQPLQVEFSDFLGKFKIKSTQLKTVYYIRVQKEGYQSVEKYMATDSHKAETDVVIKVNKQIVLLEVGNDLAKSLDIETIYFELDGAEITKNAETQLALILMVMEQFPNLKIDVRSHTDSRASDSYNLKLSEKRAANTIQWFVSKGISSSRLSGKGYGETLLVNNCVNGVKCSEAAHQENRRSEFVIFAVD